MIGERWRKTRIGDEEVMYMGKEGMGRRVRGGDGRERERERREREREIFNFYIALAHRQQFSLSYWESWKGGRG